MSNGFARGDYNIAINCIVCVTCLVGNLHISHAWKDIIFDKTVKNVKTTSNEIGSARLKKHLDILFKMIHDTNLYDQYILFNFQKT